MAGGRWLFLGGESFCKVVDQKPASVGHVWHSMGREVFLDCHSLVTLRALVPLVERALATKKN